MSVHPPRVLAPVATGDGVVWVSGTTPGATVTIRQGSVERGRRQATGPVTPVGVTGITGDPVEAVAHLDAQSATSAAVTPVRDPGEAGEFPGAAVRDVDYGSFPVPTHDTPQGTDGGFAAPLRGRVWLPADSAGQVPGGLGRRPLVVIAHGYWGNPLEDVESLKGYAWLAGHLARWGMVACSIDLSTVNRETAMATQQWSRGEVIMAMLDRLTTDDDLAGYVDRGRVGLVGHSMGGEGVVLAQAINRTRRPRYGILGLVSIAPTNHRPDVAATHTAYLQLHGSLDYLLQDPRYVTGPAPRFGGFRLHDRAWRPRSLAFIDGARHEGWNPIWLASPNSLEPEPDPALPVLPADRQRRIGQALVTAFLLDVLTGREDYRGYLAGPVLPRVVGATVVRRQHQSPSVTVIDDFGDADAQLDLPAEEPADKTVNRRGLAARTTGEGIDRWVDVDHRTDLPLSVHGTRGLDVAWRNDTTSYETNLDAVSVAPSDTLSMRLALHYDETDSGLPDETHNPVGEDLDVVVELDDGTERAAVPLSVTGQVVRYPLAGPQTYSVFQTVRLPVDAFTATNPDLDVTALKRIRLVFSDRPTGRLLVDDIEFETAALTAPSAISMLRVHDLGGGYGPPDDHIDTEVIVHLAGRPGETFGLALRADATLPANWGMFTGLRVALVTGGQIQLAYRRVGPTVREIVAVVPN
ncbi:hypothetical protein O7623_16625 [Solwaraspora sp. WMMD791]|uniref:poly(ethylene terephthalate) hydrolase family protein n=1 Tax=Solwaraspora sp. WMMD791 TaxID=3016086 RepID=UPI00249A205B|nr:hypothetical protein [Solwaraspora sp. WMMD791]WFE25046.1 hypothetical protein O7623_16625 [Solwaraspora sp. WMMD791]